MKKKLMSSKLFKSLMVCSILLLTLWALGEAVPQSSGLVDMPAVAKAAPAEILPAPAKPALPEAKKLPEKVVEREASGSTPIITLTKKNTLAFRQPVTDESVAKLQKKLLDMSHSMPKNDTIYLVLFSPGGSIDAGNLFIDTAKAVPQKVKTITIFAASMAYHMAQSLDDRYIIPSGVLMSHRARISGLSGNIPGEAVTRLTWIMKDLERMDKIAAERLKMSVKDYQAMIHDEYWITGQNAVDERSADKVALVYCSKDLNGFDYEEIQTFFGPITLKYSECPMITAPLAIQFGGLSKKNKELAKFVELLVKDKYQFVEEYIITQKYRKFLR